MGAREYDVVVIGAGAVGENVADRAAQAGLRVAIVEDELVGGECSYWACMPSKALLRPGAVLRAARAVDGARQAVSGGVDVEAALARRDRITHHNPLTHHHDDRSQVEWLASAGIDLVRGHARLAGRKRVHVTQAHGRSLDLIADEAIAVCTGSRPHVPDILRDIQPWTSSDATTATRAPSSLAIVGGGVVACEMATAFADFGTAVTVIARSGLLGGMEPFAGDAVRDALVARGARVRTGVRVVDAVRSESGASLTLSDGTTLAAEQVLVATGRAPRTDDIGLESVGMTPGSWLEVDDTMLVSGSDWLYAVGDVNGRALLTHQGKYQARAAGDAIAARAHGAPLDLRPFGTHVATSDHRHVPQVTFTDPEVASIGMTAEQAEEAGIRIRVLDYDLGWLAAASTLSDAYRGCARAVVDEDRGILVGATFVGADVGELVHAATIAVVGEVPLARLWHAVPAYPTLSEVWLRWLESYGRP
ncbi:NAD(P)/FAD-dependent oxidoreductase [Microbacterium sediminicola]|uniref:NAD(P)/FAD-dependent oxidoreductase n=1 Tax=Microbacterium sediminicola TaxID=415210 RepID=A0ABN2HI17_9MICO